MQISFRLAQILKVRGVSGRGAINEIAEKAKLKRHQVSALMQNRVKHLPLETLGAICEYLVVEHQIPRAQLPAILFALEPEELWSLLGERRYIEICFGVRPDKFRNEMIVASDSYLHGVLLKELFGAKRDERTEAGRDDRGQQNGHTLQQRLVKAFEEHIDTDEAISEAQTVY
ncbi:MAG: helix-turn-helix domain-containing protein, partial [Planctomycetes bacterium]|nr:helix-turn-helix domain-containing protein [Planctomycetota bacterium]